jgi:hypothetical protein
VLDNSVSLPAAFAKPVLHNIIVARSPRRAYYGVRQGSIPALGTSVFSHPIVVNPPNVETEPPISLLGTLLVQANEGRSIFRGAHSVVILLDGKQTGEKFTTLLLISPPGAAPGSHYHDRED